MSNGFVYVLINEAMPDLVKIGKANMPVGKRIKELFTTSVPLPFECFHASKVQDMDFVEKQLHDAFHDSRVHPKREFFRISPERVQAALLLAQVEDANPADDVLEDTDDKLALNKARAFRPPFNFRMVDIPNGATLQFVKNAEITCTVVDNKKVNFKDEEITLSGAALILLREIGHKSETAQGPLYWLYEGETLDERRRRMEEADD